MKKYVRLIAALTACILCLCMCSCQMLDDMKMSHAVWDNDKNIVYKDNLYKPLPYKIYTYVNFTYSYNTVTLTESDVPVLLSDIYGEYCYITDDEVFIEGSNTIYCREDKYDYVAAQLENPTLDRYCYEYMENKDENSEDFWDYDYYPYKTYLLTEEESALIDSIIAIIPGQNIDDIPMLSNYLYDYNVYLCRCDESLLLKETESVEIVSNNGQYYILYNYYAYEVPAEYSTAFEQIMKPAVDNWQDWNNYDYGYDYY